MRDPHQSGGHKTPNSPKVLVVVMAVQVLIWIIVLIDGYFSYPSSSPSRVFKETVKKASTLKRVTSAGDVIRLSTGPGKTSQDSFHIGKEGLEEYLTKPDSRQLTQRERDKEQTPQKPEQDNIWHRRQVDCAKILWNYNTENMYLPGSIPKPKLQLQQQRQHQHQPFTSENRVLPDIWCGRNLDKHYSNQSSFQVISEWLESGGINVVKLLQLSQVPCHVECPPSPHKGSIRIYDTIKVYDHTLLEVVVPLDRILSSRLSSLEMDILESDLPVEDYNLVSSENKSKVTILDPLDGLKVGDAISVRIDVHDGYGRPNEKDGDEIRMWIADPEKGAGTAGRVVDLGNGSYSGKITLRWEGTQELFIVLHHPREVIRTMVFLRSTLGTMRYLTSAFENGQDGETTLCMWDPVIPGYEEVCNLTSINGGLPWYCGKPFNDNLTCADWVRAQSSSYVYPLPVTQAEQLWLDKLNQ